jgi:hypothetical protein
MKHYALTALVLTACNTSFDEGQPPDELVLKSTGTSIERNGHATVKATYKFDTFELPADDVTWTSSVEAVAVLSGTGPQIAIDAVAPGVTRITATGTELTSKIDILVLVPQVRSVSITPSAPSVAMGGDVQLSASASYSDDTTADVTTKSTWISSDTNKATVTKGSVHALAVGGVMIRALMDDAQSSTLVTVTGP